MLEDIIREIVGDAAVDTVESLQPRAANPSSAAAGEAVSNEEGPVPPELRASAAQIPGSTPMVSAEGSVAPRSGAEDEVSGTPDPAPRAATQATVDPTPPTQAAVAPTPPTQAGVAPAPPTQAAVAPAPQTQEAPESNTTADEVERDVAPVGEDIGDEAALDEASESSGGADADLHTGPTTNTEQLRLAISGALDRSLGPAPVRVPDAAVDAASEASGSEAAPASMIAPVERGRPEGAEVLDDLDDHTVDGAEPTTTRDVSRETSIISGGTPLADALADETRRRIALEEAVLPLPPQTRVLTISNQKGGVGKTTTAVNLAAALARAGAKVLVIDLDPQGNASTALGVDHRSEQRSVYEVLVSDLALSEVIRSSTEHEMLDCVPATIHLAGAEIELVSLVAREQRLRRALDAHLATMERPYDYVFIDCPPSLGLLTINAFVAAREVLIPIQCEYYALEGLSQLLSNIELIEKHLNPELRLSTILLTMYDSRTNLAQQVAQEVRNHFPTQTLQTIIPRSVRVSEAPSYGQSVISYDFGSTGSLSYREAAAEIAKRGAAKAGASNKEHH